VAVAALALLVVNARQNYEAGLRALLAGRYGAAVKHLDRATVLGHPFADSRQLLAEATSLAHGQAGGGVVLVGDAPLSAASMKLREAAALFETGRYAVALDRVADLRLRLPATAATRVAAASNTAVSSLLLLVSAQRLLAAGDWRTAATDATFVLARFPSCGPASRLAAEAARRGRAAPLFARATSLADASRWVLARNALRRALAVDPAYPGGAALLGRIDAAIAARRAAQAAAATASSGTGTATTTTPPTQTAPPPPPPP
jgi:tetratricopeptide (TPR) repeat protein